MLRRSHKKSREGCLECKRRHVKCDESRPVCVLCTVSGRECSFASRGSQKSQSRSSKTPRQSSSVNSEAAPDLNRHTAEAKAVPLTHFLPISNSSAASAISAGSQPSDTILDDPVNLNHTELLVHLTICEELFNLGYKPTEGRPNPVNLFFKSSQESPCLMHMLLAFSARHLSFIRPERSFFYSHLAISLQTRAISLFSSNWAGIDSSNCVWVLCFMSILGHHTLADTLATREPGGLEPFLKQYIQFARMQKGIYSAARASWPVLLQSEIGPVLAWSESYHKRTPTGTNCDEISAMVDGAVGLTREERNACHIAINYIQIGFDAIFSPWDNGNRHHIVFIWALLVPPEYEVLLGNKRPEALVLLAYYAALLHYSRKLWQIRDSGAYIFNLIADYLGPEGARWLECPRELMAADL